MIFAMLFILPFPLLVSCFDRASGFAANDAYDFPVKPGTEEWKTFQTHNEMLKACQIPERILNNMSTAALVETVLNYPLLLDMMAYNNIQYGFDQVASRFNGLQELLNREDNGTEIKTRYRPKEPEPNKDNIKKGQKDQ